MKIFTIKKVPLVFFLVFQFFISNNVVGQVTGNYRASASGSWSNSSTWQMYNGASWVVATSAPTSINNVTIPAGYDVLLDISMANCASLNLIGSLTIQSTNSLIVTGNLTIDQSIFRVNSGYLYVGGNMDVIGNGNANQGLLSVSTGTVIVSGSIYFWKDVIGGPTNGSTAFRLLDISAAGGTISLGGTLVGGNGTTATTLAQTDQNAFIFRGNSGSNFWNAAGNWSNGLLPGSVDRVIIPFNLTANLSNDQAVGKVDIYSGAAINLNNRTLTISGNLNNNSGGLSGTTGTLKFSGSSLDQVFNSNVSVTIPNIEIDKLGKSLLLNGPLKVSNLVTVTNGTLNSTGNLTLLSTASRYAQIGSLSGSAFVNGIVNVESWFTGGPKSNSVTNNANRGTRILSSPVRDNNPSKSVYMGLKEDLIITGTGTGFDYPGNATLLTYKESATYAAGATAQYNSVTDISATAVRLKPGEGFFLFYRGDRINNVSTKITSVGGVFATPESFAITYKGEINQGPITVDLSYTANNATADLAYNGFNLIGNPYPATIDWKSVERTASVDNMVSIIKPGGGMITYSGGVVVNGGTSALPAGATAPAAFLNSFYIQPGQGFYVRARNTLQSITFKESHKAILINGTAPTLPYRLLSLPSANIKKEMSTEAVASLNTVLDNPSKAIYIELSDAFNKEETAIVFKDGNDAAFGADDATYFFGGTVSLSTLTSDAKSMAINFMPDLKDVKEIKLSVNASVSGQVKLNFKDLKAAACYQVFLKDALFPDALIDVKAKSVYEFSIDKSLPATYGMERFSIIFKPEPVEPPVLFTAEKIKSGVELSWLSEKANDIQYFEVETSPDGVLFNKTAEVRFASANMTYSFIDKAPAIGVNYYRVKQVNKNGHYAYTSIKSVNFSNVTLSANQLKVYPNPSTEYIQVQLTSRPKSVIESVIYDLSGKKLMRISFKEDEQLKLNISQLKSGFYILRLTDEATQKIIGKAKFRVGL